MENTDNQKSDTVGLVGVNSLGYGVVPKMVMQDRRLDPCAKAIYAYFCSYCGAGRTCFPVVPKICYDLGISKNTYLKHMKQLINIGYMSVSRAIENGRPSHNIYTIVQNLMAQKVMAQKVMAQKVMAQNLNPNNNIYNNNNFNNNKNNKNILCDFEQSHRSLDTQTDNNSSNLSENGSKIDSVDKSDNSIGSTAGAGSAGKFDVPVCRRKKYDYSQNKLFEQWWSLYPANRRVDKPKCYTRFCALSPDEQQKAVEQIKRATAGRTNWTRDNNFYCPLSTTYLNQERWEQVVDEIPESCRQSCGYKRLMPQTQENPQSSGKDDGLDWDKMKFL